MKVELQDRVALVTGAARNIGKAIADALAANGARVVYSDIDLAEATAAARASSGTAMHLDVADPAEVEAVVGQIVRQFGRIDILVNNAGVNTLHHRVPIDQFPAEEWERIVRVDMTGLFLVSRAVAGAMRTQKYGRIVNIASVVGLVPLRLQCAFAAAKAGVVNLTRAMAIELGHLGITANCVAPGSILTEGTKQLFYGQGGKFSDAVSQLIAHIPVGRPGSSEEVAHAVLFLAAEESRYVNGAVLAVDGGWTAGYAREF
jgi:NAD(P)-dependent dehydrogenase (short-subunit alcohol dehydrogenase family)